MKRIALFLLIFTQITIWHNNFAQVVKNCGGLPDKNIIILEGCKFSGLECSPTILPNINTIKSMKPVFRTFQFDVKFHGNCQYDTPSQTEWHKVMKITKLFSNDESIRLGWRNDNNTEIELGLYGHIGDEDNRTFLSLNHFVDTWEEEENCELILAYHGLYTKAGQNAYAIKRNVFNPNEYYNTGMVKNAYFEYKDANGNDQGAPHNMNIDVSNIKYDCESFWNAANNKGFYYSIFYEGDNYTIIANNKITAPVDPYGSSGVATPTVLIENGAHIDFVAGHEIHLTHGFHAEAGSYFHAKVLSKKINTDTILNLFDPTVPDSLISYKPVPDSILSLYEKEESQYYNTLLPTKEEEETLIFSIYPNPTKGNLTIQVPSQISTDYSIDIFNSIGYSIFQEEKVSLSKLSIDISTQAKGIYFVRIIAEKMVFLQKVVLE